MLTVKSASQLIGVSQTIVYDWVQGGLPHFRIGRVGKRGKILIDEGDLTDWLATCKVQAKPVEAKAKTTARPKLEKLVY